MIFHGHYVVECLAKIVISKKQLQLVGVNCMKNVDLNVSVVVISVLM